MRGVINFANTSAVMAGLGVANNMQTAAAGVGGLTPQQPNGLLKYQGTKGDYQVVKRNANAAIELHIKKDGSIEGWFENNGKWQKANPPYRDNINQLINQYHTEQQQQRQQAATGLPQYPSTSRQQNQAGFNNIQNKFSNAQKATTNSDEKLHELGSKIAQHFIDRINQTDDPNKVWEINKEASNYISKYAQQQHDQHPSSKAAGIISAYFDCVARATNDKLEEIAANKTFKP